MGPTELLMASRSSPKNKKELLALLPEKAVIDRLSNRYFNSNSPSQREFLLGTFDCVDWAVLCRNLSTDA